MKMCKSEHPRCESRYKPGSTWAAPGRAHNPQNAQCAEPPPGCSDCWRVAPREVLDALAAGVWRRLAIAPPVSAHLALRRQPSGRHLPASIGEFATRIHKKKLVQMT